MPKVFTVDGTEYDVKVPEEGITRNFEVADTENSGRSTTGVMIRDVIGTFYNYTIQIFPNKNNPNAYYTLYNILSSPTESHSLKVPYNGGWLTFNAYVTSGSDVVRTLKNRTWKGLSLNFVAMSPQWSYGGSLQGYTTT